MSGFKMFKAKVLFVTIICFSVFMVILYFATREKADDKYCTVTFNATDGYFYQQTSSGGKRTSTTIKQTVKKGDKISWSEVEHPITIVKGYVFSCWLTKSHDLSSKFDINTEIKKDITLYAYYEEKQSDFSTYIFNLIDAVENTNQLLNNNPSGYYSSGAAIIHLGEEIVEISYKGNFDQLTIENNLGSINIKINGTDRFKVYVEDEIVVIGEAFSSVDNSFSFIKLNSLSAKKFVLDIFSKTPSVLSMTNVLMDIIARSDVANEQNKALLLLFATILEDIFETEVPLFSDLLLTSGLYSMNLNYDNVEDLFKPFITRNYSSVYGFIDAVVKYFNISAAVQTKINNYSEIFFNGTINNVLEGNVAIFPITKLDYRILEKNLSYVNFAYDNELNGMKLMYQHTSDVLFDEVKTKDAIFTESETAAIQEIINGYLNSSISLRFETEEDNSVKTLNYASLDLYISSDSIALYTYDIDGNPLNFYFIYDMSDIISDNGTFSYNMADLEKILGIE